MRPVHLLVLFSSLGLTLASPTAQTQTYFLGKQAITELNTPTTSNTFSPTLTEDELYMIFASDRPGGLGSYDLYETRRTSVELPWATPVALTQLNSPLADYEPNISYDGLELYFISTRTGGLGASDIYVSRRANATTPWSAPQNLGAPLNGPGFVNDDVYLSQDGLTMYFTFQGADIYTATRAAPGLPWGNKQPFAPANSTANDHSPIPDGNDVLWFSSDRAGGTGSSDYYMIFRDPTSGAWSTPVEIKEINTTAWESNGWHSGLTGRFYVSSGGPAGLFILCPRLEIIWVPVCLVSALVPKLVQIFPPKIVWTRVWLVSIQVPVLGIRWFRWLNFPSSAGVSVLMLSPGLLPQPIPIPGFDGAFFLDPLFLPILTTQVVSSSGLSSLNLPVPQDRSLIGVSIYLQAATINTANSQGVLSEPARIQFTQ